VPEDEQDMHDCPRCGLGPGDEWPPLSEEEIDARLEADRVAREAALCDEAYEEDREREFAQSCLDELLSKGEDDAT
jgi:hypothetical protein